MSYDANWSAVSYSLIQWQEFDEGGSCKGCTLEDPIIGVNRAYQQFAFSGRGATLDAETSMTLSLLPTTLYLISQTMAAILTPLVDAQAAFMSITDPVAIAQLLQQSVLNQWIDCASLEAAMGIPASGITSPFLTDIPLPPATPPLPGPPEFCAFAWAALANLLGSPVPPSQLGTYGLELDPTAAQAFLQASIGTTTETTSDPVATAFVIAFLTVPRDDLLAALAADPGTAPLAAALSLIPAPLWGALQGYLVTLSPSWGKAVLGGWVAGAQGGLVVQRSAQEWLYGYVDPIMLTAAQSMHPADWALRPWLFKPQLSLGIGSERFVQEELEPGLGHPMTATPSYKIDEIGRYHPYVQHKSMQTGNVRGSFPQLMLRLTGAPYVVAPRGLLNVTGSNEGLLVEDLEDSARFMAYDSVLTRVLETAYTGEDVRTRGGLNTKRYAMTQPSLTACDATAYAAWLVESGFDQAAYWASVNGLPPLDYWNLMSDDEALAAYIAETPIESLSKYFGSVDIPRDRCAVPEPYDAYWDRTALYACPTLVTMPYFGGASEAVINATGGAGGYLDPDLTAFRQWWFGVDKTTGFTVAAHKAYQYSNFVERTPLLYPDLWVAPDSAATFGAPSDGIVVPSFYVVMSWEPTLSSATLLRGLNLARNVMYWILVVSCPALCWLGIIICSLILTRSVNSKRRTLQLKELQKSTARKLRLTKHEVEMVEALVRVAQGSTRVVVPEEIPEGDSDPDEDDVEVGGRRTRAKAPRLAPKTFQVLLSDQAIAEDDSEDTERARDKGKEARPGSNEGLLSAMDRKDSLSAAPPEAESPSDRI
ncbi:hypothetical protein H632_c1290p0, partial [Helicosporidium sp. ATCC 50920]